MKTFALVFLLAFASVQASAPTGPGRIPNDLSCMACVHGWQLCSYPGHPVPILTKCSQ